MEFSETQFPIRSVLGNWGDKKREPGILKAPALCIGCEPLPQPGGEMGLRARDLAQDKRRDCLHLVYAFGLCKGP